MMKGAGIIISKELKRVFGDRKLVFSLFILPALLVIVIYGLMGQLIGNMESDITEHISVVYIVNESDSLKQILTAAGYETGADVTYLDQAQYDSDRESLEAEMLAGDIDLIVVQDRDFDQTFAAYTGSGDRIPDIRVYYNSVENYSSQAYSVFSQLLDAYRTALQSARFGDIEVLNVFTETDELIIEESKADSTFISMMLPYLITIMLFAGAMSVGVDAIAGEKERGTLATMLITPVGRNAIAFGKLVSMAILSGLSAVVYSVAMIVAMPLMGSAMGDAVVSGFGGISFSPLECLELLVIMLTMVYLYVAIIGLLSVLAKNTKTASTYISPVYIVVIMLGMVTMFNTGETPTYRYFIPIYGNAMAISDLCAKELTAANFGASMLGTVLLAIILTAGIAAAFNDERFMFNS